MTYAVQISLYMSLSDLRSTWKTTYAVQKKDDLVDTLELEKIHEKIREEMNERVHNRELVGNRNSNPFMKDNNYIKDLDIKNFTMMIFSMI